MNQIIDWQRSAALLKLNFHLRKRGVLLAVAGFYGFVFLVSFFVARHSPPALEKMHLLFYFILLYGGAAFIAGNAFRNMNNPAKSISYLSLPASVFEKYLIPWLITGIAWAVVSILSYIAVAALFNGLWSVLLQFPYEFFNPFTIKLEDLPSVAEPYLPYMLIHSVFFLGAAAFRKYPIPKTLLAGFIVNSIFTFISLFTMLILFGDIIRFSEEMGTIYFQNPDFVRFFSVILPEIVRVAFLYVIPVILYVAAYFKLKEREV